MSDMLLPFTAFKAARLAIARAQLPLEGEKRVALMNESYSPSPTHERWGDIAPFEVVGPGYIPGGKAVAASLVEIAGGDIALTLAGPIEWPGSAIRAKWAVMIEPAGAETVSADRLIGYADLAPGRVVTTRTGTFRLTFQDNHALLLV